MIAGVLLVALTPLLAQDSSTQKKVLNAEGFDSPLKTNVVDYGPSPFSASPNQAHVKLSCFYFPDFVVKQYDEAQKGVAWLSILRVTDQRVPRCQRSHEAEERIIAGREWSGYFAGAKSHMVFFRGDDGYNGGVPFAVYDSTSGRKVFEDSAYESSLWNREGAESTFDHLTVSTAKGGGVIATYLRVKDVGCDLHQEKTSCWESTRAVLKLKAHSIPTCTGYDNVSDCLESIVAYPVELRLSPHPSIRSVIGPTKCWPVD